MLQTHGALAVTQDLMAEVVTGQEVGPPPRHSVCAPSPLPTKVDQ